MLTDSARDKVSRSAIVWTTPMVSVSGAASVPSASTDVFHMMLTLPGASIAFVTSTGWPWASAAGAQLRNHSSSSWSQQLQPWS